mgnify:FL=1
MQPKKIIIKTLYKKLNTDFCNALKEYPRIKFFNKKINGQYVTTIKCSNYYNDGLQGNNVYGSYVYLYTSISLILSELIIKFFESHFISFLINDYYFYFSNTEKNRIKNISSIMLDLNFPSDSSRKLYLYKKDLILSRLLNNFRHHNHLSIEGFANFNLDNYFSFLDDVIEKSAHVYFSNSDPGLLINFILNNFFK